MKHRKNTKEHVITECVNSYALEHYGDFSHNKAKSIRRWKRDLKSKARQDNRRRIDRAFEREDDDYDY